MQRQCSCRFCQEGTCLGGTFAHGDAGPGINKAKSSQKKQPPKTFKDIARHVATGILKAADDRLIPTVYTL